MSEIGESNTIMVVDDTTARNPPDIILLDSHMQEMNGFELCERLKADGSGYPDGLAGENIPLSARIMDLADVYDALRSKRPYKLALTHEKSCEMLREGAGRHFDPTLIEAFTSLESEFAVIREQMN